MTAVWNKLDKTQTPNLPTITAWVNAPLWDAMLQYIQATYQTPPVIEYSGCGMMPGWNVKFKKSGKGLCTLYPAEGGFTALVVIGQKEKPEMELALPALTPYTQSLYANTREGMGQRWLMFNVQNEAVLRDVQQCIALRRKAK